MWVPLVENNELEGEGTIYFIRKYVQELLTADPKIDTVVLACTHYPLLRPLIVRCMPPQVQVIGQGHIVADSLGDYLKRHPELEERLGTEGRVTYYTTDEAEWFERMGGIFMGEKIKCTRLVI